MTAKIFILLFLLTSSLLSQDTVNIIIDEPSNTSLPRNFRKCNGGFQRLYDEPEIDTTGLNGLNISGSAEFGALNFPSILEALGKKRIIVIDLRLETHFLVNGISISWYGRYDWANLGLSRSELFSLEEKRIDSVKNLKTLIVRTNIKKDKSTDTFLEYKDTALTVERVQSEEQFVEPNYGGYLRITSADHREPLDSDVDMFVDFMKTLEKETWLHFHCHAGDGRTTTFMVMYDMIRNAKLVAMEDIIKRQYLIGGIDLSKDEDFPAWDKQYALQRTAFLADFYNYCREDSNGFITPYSEWINKRK